MRMYFRTDYYADVGIDEVVRLQRGNTYEVVSETEFFYFIVTDNKIEKFEEGGGAI